MLFDFAVCKDDDLIRDIENALLMRDHKDCAILRGFAHLLENADQILETPEVDAGFRLIEDCKLDIARKDSTLTKYKLEDVANAKGIVVREKHRALSDCYTCYDIYQYYIHH